MDLVQHLLRQMAFSHATFGPGRRTEGVIDHIEKEIKEVRASGGTPEEWVDLVKLALDGLTRAIIYGDDEDPHKRGNPKNAAEYACFLIEEKQGINEARDWPDWRTTPKDRAIEHLRPEEVARDTDQTEGGERGTPAGADGATLTLQISQEDLQREVQETVERLFDNAMKKATAACAGMSADRGQS